MNPISAPLTRRGNVDLIGERLAVRNTALGDAHGTIVPCRLIKKHAMVMEGAGTVKIVGRMDDEGVVHADRDWRRAGKLNKNGERVGRGGRKPTAKCH